jgi:hypothetical protein
MGSYLNSESFRDQAIQHLSFSSVNRYIVKSVSEIYSGGKSARYDPAAAGVPDRVGSAEFLYYRNLTAIALSRIKRFRSVSSICVGSTASE